MSTQGTIDEDRTQVAAALAGDREAFGGFVERYRAALQVHCYRMLGSLDDAEDMVQETFLRAWNKRASFERRSAFRSWLYRIATNACLDHLDRRGRQAVPADLGPSAESTASPGEVPWLQPVPDRLLDEAASAEADPQAVVIAKETIELAFLTAIQYLPPRQRAILVMRDVLGWPAKDAAELLGMTVASANSGLQRARASLKEHLPPQRSEWAPEADPTTAERALLQQYMDAHERVDLDAITELLCADARLTMPPHPSVFLGRDAIVEFAGATVAEGRYGEFRVLPTRANRQPACAKYVRRAGDDRFRAQSLDVLRFADGKVAEITTFMPDVFAAFGLPPTWELGERDAAR
ncbi:sigma-70 family RNA polymerase sigma factor [Amycolatopsis sp. NPDC049688]|uniref:sigma-70 family RNA polymerase sigma factor n=1 Tax=Amycolatopsis sp. NPDC049688 TaxID=3154733 RepID=UPI00342CA90A